MGSEQIKTNYRRRRETMRKRYLICLLAVLMVLSPAAVFAENEGTEGENASTTELTAAETSLDVAEEDDVYTWVDGTDYTEAVKNGQKATGVFKAKRFKTGEIEAEGTSLFYATQAGVVEKKEQLVSGKDYIHEKNSEGEAWRKSSGSYTYLVTLHEGYKNGYFVYWQEGLKSVGGNIYYVQSNGTVRTDAGVLTYGGAKYYIQQGGAIQTIGGWVTDTDGTRYYLPAESASSGKLRIDEGLFQADGKTWYSAAGGAVRTTGGLFSYNGSQYYANDDGSVNTAAGFITVNGKKYLCENGGAIRSAAGVVSFGVSLYLALDDGSICTTPGFITAGGRLYYVGSASGELFANKAFKLGSKKYHALADGSVAVGVHKWGKNYYYSKGSGAIRTKKGIVSWAGNRYYVKKGGKITTKKKFKYKGKTYIAGSDGAFRKGIFTWKKNLYYASSKGVLRTKAGLFTYNGIKYYSRKGGKLYRNKLFTAGKKKYLAQSDGSIRIGYFVWKNKFYLTDSKGAVFTKEGMYTYSGKLYYVKKGGPLAVNQFVKDNGNYYYTGSTGAVLKTPFKYNGLTITPNSHTGVVSPEDYYRLFPNEEPQQAE